MSGYPLGSYRYLAAWEASPHTHAGEGRTGPAAARMNSAIEGPGYPRLSYSRSWITVIPALASSGRWRATAAVPAWQLGHHVATSHSRTGLPRNSESRWLLPSGVVKVRSGATAPSLTTSAAVPSPPGRAAIRRPRRRARAHHSRGLPPVDDATSPFQRRLIPEGWSATPLIAFAPFTSPASAHETSGPQVEGHEQQEGAPGEDEDLRAGHGALDPSRQPVDLRRRGAQGREDRRHERRAAQARREKAGHDSPHAHAHSALPEGCPHAVDGHGRHETEEERQHHGERRERRSEVRERDPPYRAPRVGRRQRHEVEAKP